MKRSYIARTWWKYLILSVLALLVLSPFIWIVLQSFKGHFDTIAVPPKIIFSPTIENYVKVFTSTGFLKAFFDSTVVAIGSVLLCLVVGTPFGYILARYRFPGRDDIGFFILSTRMLPAIVVIVPFILIFNFLHINDTYIGLILSHLLMNIALVVWMTRGYFDGVPVEIEDAAAIDGLSQLGVFVRIVFPISAPGIAATAILAFLFSWNELLFALTLTSFNIRTLPVFMSSTFVGYLAVNWGALSAAGVIAIIPTTIFIMIVQKNLVRGLSFGAIK
ncbi:MAG: carbohydrate ABC transporter permease [Rectinemataceae bacterium]|jgi:multiple sugar transport system permease protein